MSVLENLKYNSDHEWIRVDGDEAYIGFTGFAQGELGDVVFVEVETEGETLDKEEAFGTIEAVKTVSDLFMPISGEVVEFNAELEDAPELINSDPFEKGWIIKVKISDQSEIDGLMNADEYQALIGA